MRRKKHRRKRIRSFREIPGSLRKAPEGNWLMIKGRNRQKKKEKKWLGNRWTNQLKKEEKNWLKNRWKNRRQKNPAWPGSPDPRQNILI